MQVIVFLRFSPAEEDFPVLDIEFDRLVSREVRVVLEGVKAVVERLLASACWWSNRHAEKQFTVGSRSGSSENL